MRMLLVSLGAVLVLATPGLPPPARAGGGPAPPVAGNQAPAPAPGTQAPIVSFVGTIVEHDSGAELIGRPAPPWSFTRWVRGPQRSLEDFRGKVVLLRWWTEGCRFCGSTLPVIDKLQARYGGDLVVIGVFHPKPPHEVGSRHILAVAKELGFGGPIAFDRDWRTLERYWLDADPERSWTSVSFLIDRGGIIRWVHGGGEYHPSTDPRHARCDAQYQGLEQALAETLAERVAIPVP